MARKKQYNEEEVIEKAMTLFWENGYHATSMLMLEKKMGINKFSIYARFGNKHGLFLESLKCYKTKSSALFKEFRNASKGLEDIKQFFYNSVDTNYKTGNQRGCLITNTYNEFSRSDDLIIKEEMTSFMDNLKTLFIEKLAMDPMKDKDIVMKQANYLLLAKHGLAAAARVNTKKEIEDYIEMTFKNL